MKVFVLSGGIGEDVLAQELRDALDEAGGDDFTLNLNSPGGFLSDGFEMFNLIQDYTGKKTVVLNGYVASIASYLAMAFDEVVARPNSAFMIHNAWTIEIGNADVMRKKADHLDALSGILADAYVAKTGKPRNEILSMMAEERWLYGKEIVDEGFADVFQEGQSSEETTKETVISAAIAAYNEAGVFARRGDFDRAVALALGNDRAGMLSRSVSNARRLIRSGDFDDTSAWSFSGSDGNKLLGPNGDDWATFALWHLYENTDASPQTKARYGYPYGKNGKVYRSALRAIASRAAQQNLEDLSNTASDLLSLMDDQRQSSNRHNRREGAKRVTKEEVLASLKELRISLPEAAAAIGSADLLMTDEARKAMDTVHELSELGYADPVATIKSQAETIKTTENARVDNRLRAEFDPDGLGEKNLLLVHAQSVLGSKAEAELDAAIEAFKKDPIAEKLAKEQADSFSEANRIGRSEGGNNKKNDYASGAVIEC